MSDPLSNAVSAAAPPPSDGESETAHAGEHVPLRFYIIIFAALMVLLVLTLVAARIDLGKAGLFVAMAIATIKAALIFLYFMHIRWSSRLTWVCALASFFWLAILFVFTFADYLSRG